MEQLGVGMRIDKLLSASKAEMRASTSTSSSASASAWSGHDLYIPPIARELSNMIQKFLRDPSTSQSLSYYQSLLRSGAGAGTSMMSDGGTKGAADIIQREVKKAILGMLQQPPQLQSWHEIYHLDLFALGLSAVLFGILIIRAMFMLLQAMIKLVKRRIEAAIKIVKEQNMSTGDGSTITGDSTSANRRWSWTVMKQVLRTLLMVSIGRDTSSSASSTSTIALSDRARSDSVDSTTRMNGASISASNQAAAAATANGTTALRPRSASNPQSIVGPAPRGSISNSMQGDGHIHGSHHKRRGHK